MALAKVELVSYQVIGQLSIASHSGDLFDVGLYFVVVLLLFFAIAPN